MEAQRVGTKVAQSVFADAPPVATTSPAIGATMQRAVIRPVSRDQLLSGTPEEERVAERRAAWPTGEHLDFLRTRFIPGATVAQATNVLANLVHFSDDQFHKALLGPQKIPAELDAHFDMDHTNWPLLPLHDHATVRGIVTRWQPPTAADPSCYQTLLELHVKGAPTPDHEQAMRISPAAGGVNVAYRVSTKRIEREMPDWARGLLRRWVGWQMARALEKKMNLFEGRIERNERGGEKVRSGFSRFTQWVLRPFFCYTAPRIHPEGPPPLGTS